MGFSHDATPTSKLAGFESHQVTQTTINFRPRINARTVQGHHTGGRTCKRGRPLPRAAPLTDGLRLWQGFSGNNSSDCVLVGRFGEPEAAEAFLSQLLPGYQPGERTPQSWLDLFKAHGLTAGECFPPDNMATLGRALLLRPRVLLIDDGAQPDVQHATWMRQIGAVVLRGEAKALHAWLPPGAGKTSADYVYVVDPLGNAMMRFAMPFDATQAAKAKRDLDRLLQASASWDKAGR